jgi:single-strand DNA-binding protein
MLRARLIGHIAGEPEQRTSTNGTTFLRFTVASNGRTRAPDGTWQDHVDWVRVAVFGQRADTLPKRLRKGQRVFVDGRLEARTWTDQLRNLRAGLEVIADTVEAGSDRQREAVAASANRNMSDELELDLDDQPTF